MYNCRTGNPALTLSQLQPFLFFALFPTMVWLLLKPISHIRNNWLRNCATRLATFLVLVSVLQFLLSISTGSVDISDLWGFIVVSFLVWLPFLGFKFSGDIMTRWTRITAKSASTILAIPACLLFLCLCLGEAGCTKRALPAYSPDGGHVALVQFRLQGALGDDYGSVYVRRTWLPIAQEVFSGVGSWDFKVRRSSSPEVRWLDSSRLLIRYADGNRKPAICGSAAAGIQVVCENTSATSVISK